MAKGKKKRTPSRIRCEQSHPTMSWRVSKELHDRLQVVKEAEGKSATDLLKVNIGLLEAKVSKEKEAIKRYLLEHGWGHADCVNRRY